MRRFLNELETYERVGLREDEFESLVPRFVAKFAPGLHWGDWKPLVESPHGRVRPDAVLLGAALDRWWVVEVELASHPETHFRDQFNALCEGFYGRHMLPTLVDALPSVDPSVLEDLLLTERPGFLCIADESSQPLNDACIDFGFHLAVMTPYRSDLGRYGVFVSRFPRDLTVTRGALAHVLTLASPWGGRMLADLPKSFPEYPSILVRYQDAVHELRVMRVGQRRRLFLPVTYSPRAGLPPVLVSVDPARTLYELDGGQSG